MHSEDEVTKIVEDLKRRGLSDAVYRALWYDYVLEDIEGHMTDSRGYDGPPLSENAKGMAQIAASRYVYDGDYDCTIPYWDNIDNLIDELEREEENEK